MKIKTLKIVSAFFAVLVILAGCKKEDPVTLEAQMDTWGVRNITSTTAELSGIVVAGNYAEYGVCWSTAANPTVDGAKASATAPEGAVYWVTAEKLDHLTKYYARAYSISDGAVTYGEETSFTTLANIATVILDAPITNIAGKSATATANVPYDGKSDVTVKGICWSTTPTPTIEDDSIIDAATGTGISAAITGLDGATTYYVRAYAINKIGTAYSNEVSFTTLTASPTITTDSLMNETKTSFDAYGTLVVDGGATVTEKGFVWSTSENPTTADNMIAATNADFGSYSLTISGLDPGVMYHVRAYAINSAGTEYGADMTIKTVTDLKKLWIPGGYQVESGYSTANWTPAEAPIMINTKDNKVLEGYIYFAAASEFKFTSSPDWDHTNYGKGTNPGELSTDNTAGNLTVSEAGLYRITVDLVNLTYTITKMDWRLIGDAVGGWDNANEVDMIYNKTLHQLIVTTDLAANIFKFRANHIWGVADGGYNYGDNDADGTVEYDGANISVATAGTYTVMLNLATRIDKDDEYLKLSYTQAVTTWGIIGDAAGGWGDTDDLLMTPDIATNTWTYTGPLAAGAFKFRANAGWTVNLGGAPDKLEQDGANLDVATAGNYTVVLNLADGTYTITPAK